MSAGMCATVYTSDVLYIYRVFTIDHLLWRSASVISSFCPEAASAVYQIRGLLTEYLSRMKFITPGKFLLTTSGNTHSLCYLYLVGTLAACMHAFRNQCPYIQNDARQ